MKFLSRPRRSAAQGTNVVLSAFICVYLWLICSCGYHVAGKADLVPKSIHTIAVPPFSNATLRYKLTDSVPEAISREFIERTRYQIASDPASADAVLRGTIVNFVSYPILFDQQTGRASGLQVNVTLQVTLTERATGKVIYSRPNFDFHDRYEIAVTNTNQYFDESGPALDRLSRSIARDVVSSILDNF